jgi:hypothetical protein
LSIARIEATLADLIDGGSGLASSHLATAPLAWLWYNRAMCSSAVAYLTVLLFTANPYLEEGRSFYQSLRFREAESRLRLARENPGNTADETREILDLLARSVSAFGKFNEAEEIYAELLAKDPHAPAPSHAAPAIMNAFRGAKERLYAPDYVKLSLGRMSDGTLEVLLIDPWQRAEGLNLVDAEAPGKKQLAVEDHRATVDRATLGRQVRVEAQSASGQVLATLDLSLLRAAKPSTEPLALALSPPAAPAGGLATAGPAPRPRRAWLIAAGSGTAATVIGAAVFGWRGLSEKRQIEDSLSRSSSQERISTLTADRYRSLESRANRDLTLAVVSASASLIFGAATVYLWNQN